MKPRLTVIQWEDAHGTKDEMTDEEAGKRHTPAMYWSAGILVKSDEMGVTIAQDWGQPLDTDDTYSWRTTTFVPRALVRVEVDAGPLVRRAKKPQEHSSSLE